MVATTKIVVKCTECPNTFEKWPNQLKVVCSEACGAKRRKKQLKEINIRRRHPNTEKKKCAVCGKLFLPKSSKYVYCDDPKCKREGLNRAIQRQTEKRRLARKMKQQEQK